MSIEKEECEPAEEPDIVLLPLSPVQAGTDISRLRDALSCKFNVLPKVVFLFTFDKLDNSLECSQ